MTDELAQLLAQLQERYQIEPQDMEVLGNAIDTTVQEAVMGFAQQQGDAGMEGAAPMPQEMPEEGM